MDPVIPPGKILVPLRAEGEAGGDGEAWSRPPRSAGLQLPSGSERREGQCRAVPAPSNTRSDRSASEPARPPLGAAQDSVLCALPQICDFYLPVEGILC